MKIRTRTARLVSCVVATSAAWACSSVHAQEHSVARQWCELLLESIRNDYARPPVHARNLHHVTAAMHDAWALYEDRAFGFLVDDPCKTVSDKFPFEEAVLGTKTESIELKNLQAENHTYWYANCTGLHAMKLSG